MKRVRITGFSWVTLFITMGTLLCCALPIILVALGMGAAVAALIGIFPFLIILTKHKIWIFVISGVLLLMNAFILWRSAKSCPTDPTLAVICERAQIWNKRIYLAAVMIWLIGFGTAYLLAPLTIWLIA